VVALASAQAHADPPGKAPQLPEALVHCTGDRCDAMPPFGARQYRLCVSDSDIGPRKSAIPELVDERGRATPMVPDGKRWCTEATRGARAVVRVGRRTFPVIATDRPMESTTIALNKFTYLAPMVDWRPSVIDLRGKFINIDVKGLRGEPSEIPTPIPRELGEPVPRRDSTQRTLEPTPLPDDRSFLDVVAVGDASTFHCTGIAITAEAVLTAAHCAPATRVALAVRTTEVLRIARVGRTVMHPAIDVALLHLETALPVTPRQRRHAQDAQPPAGVLRAVGFGVDDPQSASGFGIKRRADVMVSSWGCDAGRQLSAGCLPAAEMVIAAIGGRDTCWGDSGGPVLEPFDSTWRLIAITSRPTLHAGSECGRGGIYIRVDAIDAWLNQALENKS
jgi:Trypsin